MIILDVEQGTQPWLDARLGIPTASAFSNILTPTFKASGSQAGYLGTLLAEYIKGEQQEQFSSKWTERGHDLEPSARMMYAALSGNEVEQVGMVYKTEAKDRSCSPDGLIERVRGLEIKCPKLANHIGYRLAGELPKQYKPQVHGAMYICDIDQWDFMSYHPEDEPFLITVERDEAIDKAISKELDAFCEKLENEKARIDARTEF